tara:strand:+ start:30 stop:983 length:954 start_codon:yes stop_codon:yes gene_type:complete
MTTSYNRKTLFLKDGNDSLKLALGDLQTTLVYVGSVDDQTEHKDFLIEGPGSTIVKGSSLKLEESSGANKLEVGTNDVKATVGGNSLTLTSTGLVLKDSVWTNGQNIGTYARNVSDRLQSVDSALTQTHLPKISNISSSTAANEANWVTYLANGESTTMVLTNWTAAKISSKISTATTNHETLSTHVEDWLAVPKNGDNDQTLQAYVTGLVNTEADKISEILENAPDSLNTLNELKIALESSDYKLVDIQIALVSKLNALTQVVANLTSEDPATEFGADPATHPVWYASIAAPQRDSVDQPAIEDPAENEPPASLVE